jgi:hypothetical protein
MKIDRYGRGWHDSTETCVECGQPDNCGDCNHEPLAPEDVDEMGGVRYPDGGDDGSTEGYRLLDMVDDGLD